MPKPPARAAGMVEKEGQISPVGKSREMAVQVRNDRAHPPQAYRTLQAGRKTKTSKKEKRAEESKSKGFSLEGVGSTK